MLLSRDWVETRGIRAGWAILIGALAMLAAAALVSYITRPKPPRYTFVVDRGAVFRLDAETGEALMCLNGECHLWAPANIGRDGRPLPSSK
jgi:hypothetical protein